MLLVPLVVGNSRGAFAWYSTFLCKVSLVLRTSLLKVVPLASSLDAPADDFMLHDDVPIALDIEGSLGERQLPLANLEPRLQPDHQEPVRPQQPHRDLEGLLLCCLDVKRVKRLQQTVGGSCTL